MTDTRKRARTARVARLTALAVFSLAPLVAVRGQQAPQPPAPVASQQAPAPSAKAETAMTPAQARELFRSVDQILKFASTDTGLPIRHTVKRRLTTRKAVEAFLVDKMHEDKDTARVERSAIVLKKFGLLPREFELRPFLLSLLKEQIAGYYDSKTKTVNLLNWIDPEEQKPVLAHELTHALQDQHVNLETWGDQTVEGTPHDVTEDNHHIRRDESDTAREAALEGQAMVTYMDWSLAPSAQSLRTSPDVPIDQDSPDDKADPDSPVLSRAPFVIKESLLFPYRDGLRFEQTLLKDHGAGAAFAAVLDRPPDSSYEIMHPHAYEEHAKPALLTLPDLHPLLDAEYAPYDLGVMGALDVRMLGQAFGGAGPAADLAAAWDGGVYYAAQRKGATAAEKGTTGSVALLYYSRWTSPSTAKQFARLYAASLEHKYKQLKFVSSNNSGLVPVNGGEESYGGVRFSSEEGPITISQTGREVFISEGFPDTLVDRLPSHVEQVAYRAGSPKDSRSKAHLSDSAAIGTLDGELTRPLVRLFSSAGLMRAGLEQAQQRKAAGARKPMWPRPAYTELSFGSSSSAFPGAWKRP